MLAVVAVLMFAAVALALWTVFRRKENVVLQRLQGASEAELASPEELDQGPARRASPRIVNRAGQRLANLLPQKIVGRIDRMLVMANEPFSLPAYLFIWVLTILLATVVAVYIATSRNAAASQTIGITLAIVPIGMYAPYFMLNRRVRKRQRSIIRALPDALDLLVTCIEAGLGVDAAFAMVTDKTRGPVSETFALYLKQVSLGRARRDAFAYVAERTGVGELTRMAESALQAEEMGTTLGDVLRTHSADLRLARRRRAQEAAQKAPVLMTIPLVLCFLPAMIAVVVVPSVMSLVSFIGGLGGVK